MDARGRVKKWWSGLGFGSAPGDPEENRAFFQKRVSFFLAITVVFWLMAGVTTRTIAAAVPAVGRVVGGDPWFFGPFVICGLLALFWLYVRRGEAASPLLDALDIAGTLAQTAFLTFILSHTILLYRPDVTLVTGVSFLIIARAAIVPSSTARTVTVGVLAGAPLVVAIYMAYKTMPGPTLPAAAATLQAVIWLGFGTLLSTTISRVIYGLHRRYQEASRLGQYVLERKIGEGGMGVVYLASHAMLRRPTAVKLLPQDRAGRVALSRFEREVRLTSALRHPNTIAVYDYGRTPDGVFYYAMEYLEGFDLERLVAETGPLPPGRVVRVLRQVAAALDEAHGLGLVHRDIKPSNIMLCDYANQPDFAKVLDFGLVRQIEASAGPAVSAEQSITGTPLYMSPESINEPAGVDGRADLYALGAVGYYLVTGQRLFDGASVMQVCGHHLFTPVTPPSERLGREVPASLERVLLDCLEKDREARVKSAAALIERLDACDVEPWGVAEARSWWRERGPLLRTKTREASPSQSALTVDFAARK